MKINVAWKKPQRLDNMFLSPIRQFNEKASTLQKGGRDIVYFTMGEPDFDTPQDITDFTIRALNNHQSHYAPMRGIPKLKEEIGKMLERHCGVHYQPESEIIVTSGGAEALNNAIFSAVGPGDEVIIFEPAFMHYTNMVRSAGATPVTIPTKLENGYQIEPEVLRAVITPQTRMMIINNPNNPTGTVYTKDVLEEVCEIACEYNLLVLSDEIYNRMVYGDSQFYSVASFPGMRERTLLVNGFSKTYAMTGWRLAFVAADQEIMKNVAVIHQYSTTCAPTFIQIGAAEGMNTENTEHDVQFMLNSFAHRRNLILDKLSKIPGLSFYRPNGAFYVLVDVSKIGMDGEEFANRLLMEKNVAVIPAVAFGKTTANSVRLSFATNEGQILKGIKRISEFVSSIY